VEQVNFLCKAS